MRPAAAIAAAGEVEAAARAGFGAVELAVPELPDGLGPALAAEGARLAAVLVEIRPEASRTERRAAEPARQEGLDVLAELVAGRDDVVALLVDATDDRERRAAAGDIERYRYLWTRGSRLSRLADELHRTAEACRERGLLAAALPRLGTPLETPREVDLLSQVLDPELAGLCFDVEGWRAGGGDPDAYVAEFAELTQHVRVAGDVSVLASLRASGYGAWVVADVGHDPDALARARERLDEAGVA